MKQLRSMSLNELIKAKAKIEAAIELHTARERKTLIKMLGRINGSSNGTTAHPLKGKKLPPLYQNPQNLHETWAGRGNKPKWLVAALRRGRKLESFAVK